MVTIDRGVEGGGGLAIVVVMEEGEEDEVMWTGGRGGGRGRRACCATAARVGCVCIRVMLLQKCAQNCLIHSRSLDSRLDRCGLVFLAQRAL